jgi:replication factor C subunit 3/5
MFLIDKYIPQNPDDSIFHKNILEMLKMISKDDSIPHMIFYGPSGSGKKILIKMFLEMLFDETVNTVDIVPYNVIGSGNKVTEVQVEQSDYHIVINPNNNNFDKYLIQYIVKEYAKRDPLTMFGAKRTFKVILINNVDNLSYYAQTSLRRTMEKYSDRCRFIMWCRSLSKVIVPVQSRCIPVRVNCPTNYEMCENILNTCANENYKIKLESLQRIIKVANGNIKIALWKLQMLLLCGYNKEVVYWETIEEVVKKILECKIENIKDIRHIVYNMMITNFEESAIIRDITTSMCKVDDITDKSKIKMIEMATRYEHNLIKGRREMIHIEPIIIEFMKIIFYENQNKKKLLEKKTDSKIIIKNKK